MKVLIFSITAGTGHNVTAKAIKDYFAIIGVESKVYDTYHEISDIIAKTVDKGYLMTTKNISKIYSKVYTKLENRKYNKTDPTAGNFTRNVNKLISPKIKKIIEEYEPDAIVCTHSLSGIFMDLFKVANVIDIPVYNILTDFVFHPFWEESRNLDYIVTPTELLNMQAIRKGYRISQVLPFGIPINPKFNKSENKAKVRKALGLDPSEFTILVMGGGMGYGNMAKNVMKIDKLNIDCQMIVICGNNTKAKEELDRVDFNKKVLCYGFVDNVDYLMDASDCIITKPGGLTTSEAMAKNLPMIIVNPIPGQEERNTEFLLNNGAAMAVTPTCRLEEALFQFFYYPEKIENMKRNIALLRKPNATEDICRFILNKYKEDHS